MQTPSSKFFGDLINGGIAVTYPFLLLCISELLTLYATIFIHRYLIALVCAGGLLQVLALLFYLAQYIPGGRQGLTLLLKAGIFHQHDEHPSTPQSFRNTYNVQHSSYC